MASGSYNYFKVRQTMAGAHDLLTSAAYIKTTLLKARHDNSYVSFRKGHTHPADFSMLSSIVHVSQEVSGLCGVMWDGTLILAGHQPPSARSGDL